MTPSNAQNTNVSVEEQQCIKIRQNYVDKNTDAATAILLLQSVQVSEDILRRYMEEISTIAESRLEDIEGEMSGDPPQPERSGLAEELGEGTSGRDQFVAGSSRRWLDAMSGSEDELADEVRLERRRGKERERDSRQRDREKAERLRQKEERLREREERCREREERCREREERSIENEDVSISEREIIAALVRKEFLPRDGNLNFGTATKTSKISDKYMALVPHMEGVSAAPSDPHYAKTLALRNAFAEDPNQDLVIDMY